MARVELFPLSYYPIMEPGEEVIWRGKPNIKALRTQRIVELIPVYVVCILATFFIFLPVLFFGEPLHSYIANMGYGTAAIIGGILLFLCGLCIANVLLMKHRWKNIDYFVTNRRVIICFGLVRINQMSVPYEKIGKIRVFQRAGDVRNRTKTLLLQETLDLNNKLVRKMYRINMIGNKPSGPALIHYDNYNRAYVPLLEHLENAQHVHDIIQQQILENT